MRKIRFIGDIHSNFMRYMQLIDGAEESIQVGDFGIGFNRNPIHMYDTTKHRFIRGNHDFPLGCTHEPNYIPDGTIEGPMMLIGGALSIDKEWRREGVDYWPDEELSMDELYRLYDKYVMERPRIVIAHEFPEHITSFFPIKKWDIRSRTRDAFDAMFEKHKPELWIGGHWHLNFDQKIDNCRFIVLNCDSYIDIDIDGVLDEGQQSGLANFHRG